MTETCDRCQAQFIEALYQELDTGDRLSFEAHLADCPDCSRGFESMKSTLELMSRREGPQFPSEFWVNLEGRIETRIQQDDQAAGPHRPSWAWAYRVAAGIILVLLGVGVDRILLSPAHPTSSDPGILATAPNDLELRVAQYLGRSQLLLLNLANIDTLADGSESIDLTVPKRVSGELLEESRRLKEDLTGADQPRLVRLIGDLEKVMLQVTNLEERRGLRQVRLIQKSLQQSDLLLRVNLQKLRPSLHRKNIT